MKIEKDFTADIKQVKEDLKIIEEEIKIMKAVISEKEKHKDTLNYFLDIIEN